MEINRKLPSGKIVPETVEYNLDDIYAMPKRNRPQEAFVRVSTGGFAFVDCCISDTCECVSHKAVDVTPMVEVDPGVFDFDWDILTSRHWN